MKIKRFVSPVQLEGLKERDLNISELIEYSTRTEDTDISCGKKHTQYIPIEISIPDNYEEETK